MITKHEINFEHRFQGPPRPPVILTAWQPREIACADCGVLVVAISANQTRCKACQKSASARQMQRASERLKAKRKAAKA